MQNEVRNFSVQQKMVEAGAITGLILCLTPGLAAIQAAAAKCLQKLAKDNEYHELIINAGALHALLQLLVGEETESEARAAATEAVGSVIKTERMAADTIPHLVAMAKSDQLKVLFHNPFLPPLPVVGYDDYKPKWGCGWSEICASQHSSCIKISSKSEVNSECGSDWHLEP